MREHSESPNKKWHREAKKYPMPVAYFTLSPRTTCPTETPKEKRKQDKEKDSRESQAVGSKPAKKEYDWEYPRQHESSPVRSARI